MKYVYHYYATAQAGLDTHHFDGVFDSEHPIANFEGYRDLKDRIAEKGSVSPERVRVQSLTLIHIHP